MRESQRFLSAWFLPVVLLEEKSVKFMRVEMGIGR